MQRTGGSWYDGKNHCVGSRMMGVKQAFTAAVSRKCNVLRTELSSDKASACANHYSDQDSGFHVAVYRLVIQRI